MTTTPTPTQADAALSLFRRDSMIARINASAARAPVLLARIAGRDPGRPCATRVLQ